MSQRRQPAEGRKQSQARKPDQLPADLRGIEVAPGFSDLIGEPFCIGWSADGAMMAAAGLPGRIALWLKASQAPINLDEGPALPADVRALAWHPLGPVLAVVFDDGSLWLWDVDGDSPKLRYQLKDGYGFTGLAWDPDGSRLAVCDEQGGVGIRSAEDGSAISYRRVHQTYVTRLCWSQGGQILVTCSRDRVIAGLDVVSLEWRHETREATQVRDLAVSPNDEFFASSSDDNSVRIWDLYNGRLDTVLEGHRDRVTSLQFSPDGQFLASGSAAEVRLWRRRDWECVATIPSHNEQFAAIAFHPTLPILAAKNSKFGRIDCFRYDHAVLDDITMRFDSRRYVNAKVVLVGDTGVGKSGLGLVLSRQPYTATDSSHGRHVWMLYADEVQVSGSGILTREVWLWDLAGQPSYRLVHQLHLHEVAVALVVFDSRSETDPFVGRSTGPGRWLRRPGLRARRHHRRPSSWSPREPIVAALR